MEILNITLAANGIAQYRKAGSYFEILASTGPIGVNFYDTKGGGQSDSINGGVSGLFLVTDYGAFDIKDLSGGANVVQVLVCDLGENGGSRRQPGVVQVVDSSKATTLAGSAFTANGSNVATAAAYGGIQLWNPSASGKRIVVESLTVNNFTGAAITWGLGFNAAGLTYTGGGVGAAANKISGGGGSVAAVNQSNNVGADPATLMPQSTIFGGVLAANSSFVIKPIRPLVLLPNYGLMLGVRTVNSQLGVSAEYYEESVTS